MTILRICFVGDSLTNGTNDEHFLGWPGRLCAAECARGHELTHYNLGIRAETSEQIEARWHAECAPRLLDIHPGALVFSFGVNDMAIEDGQNTRVSKQQSLESAKRMLAQAQQLGANAIVNVRFTTSAVTAGAAELYAYGTAVVAQPA